MKPILATQHLLAPAGSPRIHFASRGTALSAAGLLIAAALLAGCASAPLPSSQLAVAEAAVQSANTRSTSESAGVELQIALNKLAAARTAVTAQDYDSARRYAEQAQLDALLAERRAQAVRNRRAAQETQDAARALSEEIQRKTPG
ncbi:DUF4398 domain-containing protein [Paucibacter sp. APW11]|uniref:DUF4398 domain-containing protein n=1 Tax=Roseateles aquae TaxID=3077235 RepID=A0ABU3P589_9BURK|nr:DUF4398 domain-containing protein [Paucibacter sp. APW11]MDT8997752.1 DUF4398 domain-containing protein [Paucibacter sp. APW11]